MDGVDSGRTGSGFKRRTRLAAARERLERVVARCEGAATERLAVAEADGRVLATAVEAPRAVPHYERAAMDGWAVRAADTVGASDGSPVLLEVVEKADSAAEAADDGGHTTVEPGTASRVHTGSAVPPGADAVVRIERATRIEPTGELEVAAAVAPGENVAHVGEDVAAGQSLFEAGHRLRPSDLGLVRSVGTERVPVRAKPTVGVVPTGEELVDRDPEPGEVIETNGLTVSRLVERWGGRATYREIVTDDPEALRVAIQRDLTKDVVVTTGGSSVGERDLLPEVIDDLGEVLVHGVAIAPGYPVCLGVVEETPVLALPGYPVACVVAAVQFLRPTLRWLEGAAVDSLPSTPARLERKLASEPGTRTFARVRLEEREDAGADEPAYAATPTRTSGAGVLSSVALADGWVVVPEDREGIPAGETVGVERWE